jgi:RNA polymerase sigma-70 factor (ECF subfamily)
MKKIVDLKQTGRIEPPRSGAKERLSLAPEAGDGTDNGFLPGDQVGALVRRVLRGDTEAYRPLVENFQRAVHGLTFRLLSRNGADAEDITQETFVRAFEYLHSLEDPDRFGPWLFQIARSLCRDRLRRLETEKRVLQIRAEQLRLQAIPKGDGIASVLHQLPPDEYQVLRLRYYENCTYEEIARRMQITFSQVDHLMRKARARLAARIKVEKQRERTL